MVARGFVGSVAMTVDAWADRGYGGSFSVWRSLGFFLLIAPVSLQLCYEFVEAFQ